MSCSPSNLLYDVSLWAIPEIFNGLMLSYRNLSDGHFYDCALTIVPCQSPLVKMIDSPNTILVFWFDLVVVYILLTLVFVVGFVGNISNIIIFSTNSIAADSTNNLLLGLSVSDLMNVLSVGLLITSCYLCFLDESTALTVYNIILPHVAFATRSFTLLSLDFVTVISIQRAVAVVFPFRLSIIFSNRNTSIIMTALVLLYLIMMIPMHMALNPVWIYHPYFREEISLGTEFRYYGYKTTGDLTAYYFIYRSAFDLLLIVITGSLTVFKLKEQASNRVALKAGTSNCLDTDAAPKKTSRETKVIKMSLTVCLVTFIMCSMTVTINGLAQTYTKDVSFSSIANVTEYGLILIASINSSFNFFLYFIMSEKYRAVFLKKTDIKRNLNEKEILNCITTRFFWGKPHSQYKTFTYEYGGL